MSEPPTIERPSAEQILADMKGLVRLYETLDLSIGIDGARYWARMPLNDQTRSHVGTVHAAVTWAVAEVIGGVVVLHVFGGPTKVFLVVKHVSIDFVGPARSDVTAETTFGAAEADELVKAVFEDGARGQGRGWQGRRRGAGDLPAAAAAGAEGLSLVRRGQRHT